MAQGTLRWLGHAFFEYVTGDGHIVLFDPWTADAGNPSCPLTTDQFDNVDLILVSHDHFDHLGSAMDITKATGAVIGGCVQTVGRLIDEGLPNSQAANGGMGYNPGGGFDADFARVVAVQAFHTSDTGVTLGHILTTADGTTIYHAGDTGLFGDMALFGRLYPIDVALLPIGGVFTMDAFQAAEATKLLAPRMVVPMHYGSFPVVAPTADEFAALCADKAPATKVVVLEPGGSVPLG